MPFHRSLRAIARHTGKGTLSGREKTRLRKLLLESLESRQLMDSGWRNAFNPRDISGDGRVVPQDVLIGINELNNRQYINA